MEHQLDISRKRLILAELLFATNKIEKQTEKIIDKTKYVDDLRRTFMERGGMPMDYLVINIYLKKVEL